MKRSNIMGRLMWIQTQFAFEAAHSLPKHPGKCRSTHGHNYVVELAIQGEIDQSNGMIMDFGDLKAGLKPVFDQLDHSFLASPGISPSLIAALLEDGQKITFLEVYPTAENLAWHIVDAFKKLWPERRVRVQIWETPKSSAIAEE
jgi:6-pyruvoyltetrahydropterin/6-carboxytetrahydropterin synthase